MSELIEQAVEQIKSEVNVIDEQPAVKAPEVKKVDITSLLAAMPDTFTPATLDKLFMFNDGGKTVRRHLRKYFANEMGHEMKSKWGFSKTSNQAIIEYFANKYAYNLDALK